MALTSPQTPGNESYLLSKNQFKEMHSHRQNAMLIAASILQALLLFSCTKSEYVPPVLPAPPVYNNDFPAVIWQTPLGGDSAEYSSIDPLLIDGNVLVSRQAILETQNEMLKMFEGHTGKLLWTWDDYINPWIGQRITSPNGYYIVDGLLTVCSNQDNYGINLHDGSTKWATMIDDGAAFTSVFEGVLFHTIAYGVAPVSDSSRLIACDAQLGNWEEVFFVQKDDQFEVNLVPPAAYINDQNDTILIFQNRQIVIHPADGRIDLYCYNMTQDTLIWMVEDLDPEGNSNVRPPLIDGDRIYFWGLRTAYCLDLNSGNVLWQKRYGYSNILSSNSLIYEDLLIFKLDNGDLIALDKTTGSQIWENKDVGSCCVEMRLYGERLYFSSGRLFIVDVNTGKKLHAFDAPNLSARFPHATFIHAVAVDEEQGRMYTTDGYFLLCMELPE